MRTITRDEWTTLNDAQLLAQCEVDTYRASGPGGQKRNKTSSAVRIRHKPSGLLVIAEESRSQHQNRAKALKRLRQTFYLKLREDVIDESSGSFMHQEEFSQMLDKSGRLRLGKRDPLFWPTVAIVLDVFHGIEARVSDAAKMLGISTGNLIDFLMISPKVWEQANELRQRFGQKPLRGG